MRLLLIFLFAAGGVPVFGADTLATASRQNIAVMDLEARGGLTKDEVTAISDRLRGELVQTGKINVLERNQMNDILKEQGFQQSGACTDASCIVEVGQLLAVSKIAGGSIGKVGRVFSVSLKVIDVATGKIEQQVSADFRCGKEELISFHIKNLARQMAGLPELKKPWYKRWYFWTPVAAAGTGIGVFILVSLLSDESTAQSAMRQIPIDGKIQ